MPERPPVHGASERKAMAKANAKAFDRARGTAAQRGYNHLWQQYRETFLAQHPLCASCMRDGRTTIATVVDHITPHKGDRTLFWMVSNHQPLCKRCHDRKTSQEDGGFGNAK